MSGQDEPIYLPANENCSYHRVYFANQYFSSALHECAHWFIAGEERRKQVDYGYWYYPEGRNQLQQDLFEKVEVKPQALEWIFCQVTGYPFNVSVDNFNSEVHIDRTGFQKKILKQVQWYAQNGLPSRAQTFYDSLYCWYDSNFDLNSTLLNCLSY